MKELVRNKGNLNILKGLKAVSYKEIKKKNKLKQAGEAVAELQYHRWDNKEAGQGDTWAECNFKLTSQVREHSEDQAEKGIAKRVKNNTLKKCQITNKNTLPAGCYEGVWWQCLAELAFLASC